MNNWRELLLGVAYFRHRKLIKKSKKWSRDKVINYNNLRLEKYKNKLITQKKDYTYKSDFYTKKVSTGGTTGTPFVFSQDYFYRRQKERAYIYDIWGEIGYKPFDLRVIYRGNTSKRLISYNLLENAYIISPNKLTNDSKENLFIFLKNLKPFYLHVYPSSLISFINLLGEKKFSQLKILGVLAGSETFPITQMQYIRNSFNIAIAHWYGHSEYAVLAKYCFKSNNFCFYPTYGAVEFKKTKNHKFYKIIATSFNNLGTKFIRYDTQDLCTLSNEAKCSENNFITVKTIVGREQDFFYDSEGNLTAFGPYLFGLHNEFWSYFEKIQFRQEEKGKLKVFIVGKKNQKVNEILMERFFNKAILEFNNVLEIEKTASNKHKYFVQDIMK